MRRAATRAGVIAIVGLALGFVSAGASFAQTDQPSDQVVAEGRVVFEASCIACHQVDGAGLAGVFPPLAGNDHVFDSAYVADVLANGLTGELVVNGTTYNSVMPAFAALTPDQVTSVTAYLQFGLNGATTPTTVVAGGPTGEGESGSLPRTLLYLAATLAFLAAAVLLFGPLAVARRADGGSFGAGQVWVKTLVIFGFFLVFTVMLPSQLIKWSALSSLPSLARDLIGTAVWFIALGGGMYLLRRAQKSRVV